MAQPIGGSSTPGSSGAPLYVSQLPPAPQLGVHLHDGFYFRYSLGLSYVQATGRGPSGSVAVSGAGIGEMLALGGTPAPGLVVGGAAVSHLAPLTANGSRLLLSEATYGILLDWFPDPTDGWHVGGTIGLGFVGYGNARGYSPGASLLAGYDFWIAPQWSLGAVLVATWAPETSVLDAGALGPAELMPAAFAIEATVLCH
jgi:hypothetical protein